MVTGKRSDIIHQWKQGWLSGEGAGLSPLWSRVQFHSGLVTTCDLSLLVRSLPCFEGFSPGTPVFLLQ